MAGLAAVVAADGALAGYPVAAVVPPVVAAAALVLRSWVPRVVLVVAVLGLVAHAAVVTPGPVATLPVLVAIYTAVRAGRRVFTVCVVAPVVVATVAQAVVGARDPLREAIAAAVLPVGWLVAAAVLGEVFRQYRAYVRSVEERAVEAERTREEVAARRAGEERLRIARELHDSLTHAIAVIKLQAGVAVHLAGKRGEVVSPELAAIQQAAGEANRELRATLGLLRDDAADGRRGVGALGELVERSRAAGVVATLSVEGDGGGLPVTVDRTVYRVVQESLTNVARHAPRSRACVSVRVGEDAVEVRVEDDGPAVVPGEAGWGLAGMAERVQALGGRLEAAPRSAGGFGVRAVLPVEVEA